MQSPKRNRWVDGKNIDVWPMAAHIGWIVQTAGRIDLDELPRSSSYNTTNVKQLPYRTKMILKHIDANGQAFLYDSDLGVIKIPVELLEPVGR